MSSINKIDPPPIWKINKFSGIPVKSKLWGVKIALKTCGGEGVDIGGEGCGAYSPHNVSCETCVKIFYHIKCKKSGEIIPTFL